MKRIGEIAAILAIACGWICAQEKPASRRGRRPSRPRIRAASGPRRTPRCRRAGEPEPPRSREPVGGWWDDVFTERERAALEDPREPGGVARRPDQLRDPVPPDRKERALVLHAGSSRTHGSASSAWADDAALWEKKAFETDFPHLFVRRDGADFRVVSSAAIYDRLAVCAVVRDVIKGKPWIEVTSVRKLPEKMTRGQSRPPREGADASRPSPVRGGRPRVRGRRRRHAAGRRAGCSACARTRSRSSTRGSRRPPRSSSSRRSRSIPRTPRPRSRSPTSARSMKTMPERVTASRPASGGRAASARGRGAGHAGSARSARRQAEAVAEAPVPEGEPDRHETGEERPGLVRPARASDLLL